MLWDTELAAKLLVNKCISFEGGGGGATVDTLLQ